MNYYLEDFCCFCLNILNENFKNGTSKCSQSDKLSICDKIKTTLLELSAVIETDCIICRKCSKTVDSIYDFSKTCLKNMKILYSYKKILKENSLKTRCDLYVDLSKSNQCKNIPTSLTAFKMESSPDNDVTDSTFVKIESLDLPPNNNDVLGAIEFASQNNSTDITNVKEEFEMNFDGNEESETSWPHCEVKIEIDDNDLKEEQLTNIVGLEGESFRSNAEDFKKTPVLNKGHFLETTEEKLNQILPNEKSYKCDICEKLFNYKQSLKTHMLIHTGEKPYKCNICDKLFRQHNGLKSHMFTHTNEKQYKCDICKKLFKQQSSLKAHMIIHTEEKPHKCNICGQLFNHKSSLDNHMVTHTGERPHKCNICNKQYIRKRTLTIHMLTHSEEKHYKCDLCGKTFHHESILKKHMLIHSGDKYTCDICGKTFSLPCNLKSHILLHTGEKSHKCDFCNKLFNRKSNLKQHMLTHRVSLHSKDTSSSTPN